MKNRKMEASRADALYLADSSPKQTFRFIDYITHIHDEYF